MFKLWQEEVKEMLVNGENFSVRRNLFNRPIPYDKVTVVNDNRLCPWIAKNRF